MDKLEAEVMALLDEYNARVNAMPADWQPTWPQTELSIRVYVHLGEIMDAYITSRAEHRKAGIRLRAAIRGVRRQIHLTME